MISDTQVPDARASEIARPRRGVGQLIVNADDWGRNRVTTDKTLECVKHGSVSSASAMMFMEDSARAAELACEHAVSCGLHLNLTTPFTAAGCPERLVEHHDRVCSFLTKSRLSRFMLHPGLMKSFEYVVAAQCEEFRRLFGKTPERVDGHHHMHQCANVLVGKLLPEGTIARRYFSFQAGEKPHNRVARLIVDRALSKRHRTTDYFFALVPFRPAARLQTIIGLARALAVEVETHPVNADEYEFLMGKEFFAACGDIPVAQKYELAPAND